MSMHRQTSLNEEETSPYVYRLWHGKRKELEKDSSELDGDRHK